MSIEATLNKTVRIVRPKQTKNDNKTTNYNFDQDETFVGDGIDDETFDSEVAEIVKENYRCRIDEKIRYSTSKEGSQYQGSVKMIGTLTNDLQEGDIVAGRYKIIGEPTIKPKQRSTFCNMVRL